MRRAALGSILAACCVLPALAQSDGKSKTALNVKASGEKTFYVDYSAGRNQISFASQSTLEDFTGVCNKARGECKLDPKNVESLRGKFAIRVEDMRTGIDLRDEHLRSADWLDAAKNPEITIEVASIENPQLTGDKTSATGTLVGTCTIKGKSNPIKIPIELKYLDETPETQKQMKGDIVRVRSEFKLKLSDYGVAGPKGSDMIGLKVSDEIQVKVAVYAASEAPPKPLEADKPAGGAKPGTQPAPPKRPGN